MTHRIDLKKLNPSRAVSLALVLATAGMLTSCATAPQTSADSSAFKFWVLRYKPAVDAASWIPDEALSADPEGAALNIAAAMQRGNLEQWLSNWETPERPQLSAAQSEALLRQWQAFQGSHFSIMGRVVAEADVIVELSVSGAQAKVQIPLKHSHDRWWLTAMDPASEYLHWENSPNKIIDYIDPDSFQKHLNGIQGAKPKAKADAAPGKSTPIAGL